MRRVTDPALLAILNSPENPPENMSGKIVTDPKLLSQLNGTEMQKQNPSLFERYKNSVKEGLKTENNSPIDQFRNSFMQNLANVGIGTANLIPGVKIDPMTSMSDNSTIAAKAGGLFGDLYSYGIGGGALNAASKTPKAIAALEKMGSYIPKFHEREAIAKALSSPLSKTVAGNALFGAILNSDNQGMGALTGGLFGAAGHGAGKLMGTTDPVTKALGGGLLGAGVGYPTGEMSGLGGERGAEAGLALGAGATLIPGSAVRAFKNVLSRATPENIGTRRDSARALGYDNQTIAEATGNPLDIGIESKMTSSNEGAEKIYKHKKEGVAQQKDIIGRFLDDVSAPTEGAPNIREVAKDIQTQRESTIKGRDQKKIDSLLESIHPEQTDASSAVREAANSIITKQAQTRKRNTQELYDIAGRDTVPEEQLKVITKDKNLNSRLKQTMEDPKNIYDLKDSATGEMVKPNTVKALETMRQNLSGEIESARSNKDFNDARRLKQQRDILDDVLENSGENVKRARAKYQEESIPLEQLTEGYVGKLANLEDTDLKKVASTIFDRSQTNIKDFDFVQSKLSQENPDLWKRVVRNAIDDRLAKVKEGDPGTIFSDNILGSARDFEQFYNATKDMPEVQKQLSNLKKEFNTSSRQMKEVRKTAINRIANMSDTQLKNVSKTIFDVKQTNLDKFKEIRDEIYKKDPAAWRGIVRNEIESRLATTEGGGSDMFKKVLKNENSYNQMVAATEVFSKEAPKKLALMKDVFETLIDPKTGKAIYNEASLSAPGVKTGGIIHQLIKIGDSIVNGRYNKAATELITNPKWDKETSQLALMKNKKEKAMRLGNLLARIANSELND